MHALFLDVAKAFDRVDHNLLLSKLRSVGFSESAVIWVSSYLKGLSIRTAVGSSMSDLRSISAGVPQGSVLGPLLFIIFFADLPDAVRSTSEMYAYDTLLYDTHCQYGNVSGSNSANHCASSCV